MSKKEVRKKPEYSVSQQFALACFHGDLESIRALFAKPMEERPNIHFNGDLGLKFACEAGHLQVVRYLLTSEELTERANIHVGEEVPLKAALKHHRFDVVDYLLFSKELTHNADIVSAKPVDGESVLGYIAAEGSVEAAQYLMCAANKKGVSLVGDGMDALRFAITFNRPPMVQFLLESPIFQDANEAVQQKMCALFKEEILYLVSDVSQTILCLLSYAPFGDWLLKEPHIAMDWLNGRVENPKNAQTCLQWMTRQEKDMLFNRVSVSGQHIKSRL